MDIHNKKFSDNFQVNLFLSNLMRSILDDMQIMRDVDWDNIPEELQEKLNSISYAIKRAMDESNAYLKELENK